MINTVRSPTRITPSTESLIDVIITYKDTLINTDVVDLGLSDHLAQIVEINIGNRSRKTKTTVRRQFTQTNIDEFTYLLSKETWNDVYNRVDVNSSVEAFLDTFLHWYEVAFPFKRVKLKEKANKRWLSKGLIVSSKRMQTLSNLKRTFTLRSEDLTYIKNYQRIYKRVLREAKKQENDRYVRESTNRMKAMWRLINREIGKAPEYEDKLELKIGNNLTLNPTEITDRLNTHFVSAVEDLVKQKTNRSAYNLKINQCPNSIFIYPVTEEEVIDLIKSLKGKPTSGDDDIPENLVKQCMYLIKGPLAHIYNLSLNLGVFPDKWKTARVKPIHKKGDKHDMKNYRPISIIPVFAKILEKLMYNRIISFVQKNNIFSEAQNGFMKGKSIDTAAQSFIDRIQKALDKRINTIGIFIDLTKAYNVLNHTLLLEKLACYGIRGSTNLWFRSYLTHRKQFIEICQK